MTDLVEVLARAIYDEADSGRYGGHLSDYRFHDGRTCLDGAWDLNAFARAALTAIETAGYRVVPVEPTAEMLAGVPDWDEAVWRTMLAAARKLTP